MKKISALLLVFASTFTSVLFGQGGNPGNFRITGNFSGWNGLGPSGTLAIRNDFASQPINFFAGGSTTVFQRMTILGTNGFVGIGNSFSTPANRLHLFQPTGTFGLQITNNTTGNSATNGFSMNLIGAAPNNGLYIFLSHKQL